MCSREALAEWPPGTKRKIKVNKFLLIYKRSGKNVLSSGNLLGRRRGKSWVRQEKEK